VSRKDYVLIAGAIKKSRAAIYNDQQVALDIVVDELIEVFKQDNQRFDEARFRQASKR
jgi:hypothetical protein